MDGPTVGIIGILVMFAVLFIFRMPAAFTMMLVGFLGVAYVTSFKAALGMIGPDLWNIFSNYGLTVIPMFILVGEFVHYGGYNNSLYYATYRWFGHYRGGLAITTIMACAAFSAISGSNTATAATMSTVAIPAMKKYRYHPILNAGSVAAGSTLGVLILWIGAGIALASRPRLRPARRPPGLCRARVARRQAPRPRAR